MIRTRVNVQLNDLAAAIEKRKEKAQLVLDEQILKDSNNYAPQDTSELINSSLRMSLIGQGQLIWATPYARRLYYNPQYNFSKDKNPNAQGLWFEAAKAAHLPEWLNLAAREMGGRVR
jgi:hypothetical protein